MRQLWLCDKCGETYEVDIIVGDKEKVEPKTPSLFKRHDEVHKAKGENYAWIVLSYALP